MTRVKLLENLLRVAVYEKELLELEKEALQKQLDKITLKHKEFWVVLDDGESIEFINGPYKDERTANSYRRSLKERTTKVTYKRLKVISEYKNSGIKYEDTIEGKMMAEV